MCACLSTCLHVCLSVDADVYDFVFGTGRYFDGWEQPLRYEMKFRTTIPCNFRLHRYPFGSHTCPGTFYVLNGGQLQSMVFRSAQASRHVNYTGKHDLREYKLLRITYDHDDKFIVLRLHLKSLYDYHLMNSFLPSAIVFMISLTTLFFPVRDFNERIMVSLTVLVVLAALFTQASSASVKTPYFKLLDVWYTALVALCFFVVVVNAVIHHIINRKDFTAPVAAPKFLIAPYPRQEEKNMKLALKFNYYAIITMISMFLVLVFTYVMVGADIV